MAFLSQACLKMSVVSRARAIRTKGVWPQAVTAATGTTLVHAFPAYLQVAGTAFVLNPDAFGFGQEEPW